MHPRITNKSTQTRDVRRFSFESAGVLAFLNEYSGFAVRPAHYIAFAERKLARPVPTIYHFRKCLMTPLSDSGSGHNPDVSHRPNHLADRSPRPDGVQMTVTAEEAEAALQQH